MAKKESGLVFRYYRCTKNGTDCEQKYVRDKDLVKQYSRICQKVALPDDWLEPILNKLDEDQKEISQLSQSFAQNLEDKIEETDEKLSKVLDLHLGDVLSLEE